MTSFDPQKPTIEQLSPPLADYDYFVGASAFDPGAIDYSPANAAFLADTSLMAYEHQDVIARLFHDNSPLPSFTFTPASATDDTGCFLLSNDNCVIVAFRGTRVPGLSDPLAFLQSVEPSLHDVITDVVEYPPQVFAGGRVHGGFLKAYLEIAPGLKEQLAKVKEGKAVWFTGHSLGGALAVVAAVDFREFQGLYTLGCPGVGDTDFTANFQGKNCIRIVHYNDFVTRLPPPFAPAVPPISFTWEGSLVYIDKDGTINVGANPSVMQNILLGNISLQDIVQDTASEIKGIFSSLFGPSPTALTQVKVPPGPIADHAPIYYTTYLKAALAAK
jgi:triacylglycerol lipase